MWKSIPSVFSIFALLPAWAHSVLLNHWQPACLHRHNSYKAPAVHTTLEKFENTALFLQFRPKIYENAAFRIRYLNRRNLKTLTLRFSVDGNHFENGAFRKRWRHYNHVIFLPELLPQTQIQNSRWLLCVFSFSVVVWTRPEASCHGSFLQCWPTLGGIECRAT